MKNRRHDQIHFRLEDSATGLFLNLTGEDRPKLIAEVARFLEDQSLYVASMSFHLLLTRQEIEGHRFTSYDLDVIARGGTDELHQATDRLEAGELARRLEQSDVEGSRLHPIPFPHVSMFHLALYTPDRPGITARLAEEIGKSRPLPKDAVNGSFVHLLAHTYNDGGPQGGTPYYSLRANVATPSPQAQKIIVDSLHRVAAEQGMEGDLWTHNLDRPIGEV